MVKEKVSGTEIAILFFLIIMATSILYVPAIAVHKAEQSAWLSTLVLPAVVAFLSLWTVARLAQYFPEKTLVQYNETLFGRVFGTGINLVFIGFFTGGNMLIIREFAEFLAVMFLRGTPVPVLCIMAALVSAYIVSKGFEVIARMAEFILPLFVLVTVVLLLLVLKDVQLDNFTPLLEGGVMPVVYGSIVPAAWYGEVVFLAMLFPFVNKPQEVRKKINIVIILIALTLTLDTAITLGVFGPKLSGLLMFPFLALAGYIRISRYVQRLDIFVMTIWVGAAILKISLFYYIICLATAQTFRLNKKAPVLFTVLAVQVAGAVLLAENSLQLIEFMDKYWSFVALVFETVVPALIFAVAFFKGPKRRAAR